MALGKKRNKDQVKNPFIKISGILFIATMIYLGCNNSSSTEKQKQDSTDSMARSQQTQVKTNTDTILKYQIVKEHESIKDEWKQEVADNEKKISDLDDRISNEEKKIRDKDRERLDELKERNDELKVAIDGYKEDGEQAWMNFKNKTDADAKELGDDLDDFGKSIKDFVTDKKKK